MSLSFCFMFQLLLLQPNGPSLLEEFDERENTPLHAAASKGYIKIVKVCRSPLLSPKHFRKAFDVWKLAC